MKKLIVNILVGVVFLTIAGTAKATEPEVTFTQEMADAIMVDVVAKMDSLDQESFAKWLYEQGKQSETQNLAVANVFYTSYLTALRGVIIMTHVTPEIYANQSFWLSVTANIKDIQRFAIRNANRYPLLSQTLYNCELYSKGLQLRSARLLDKKLASIDDPELKRDWFLLKKIREIFELYNSFIQERQPEIDAMMRAELPLDTIKMQEFEDIKSSRDSWSKSLPKAESNLTLKIMASDTTGVAAQLTFNSTDVQKALNEHDAIVEYFICQDENSVDSYYAIVLTSGMKFPAFISIASEDRINAYLGDEINYKGLYQILWKPLEPLIENSTEIYVIPAGIIHRVPFAGLHDGQRFLYDRYTIRHLLSGKDVIDHRADNKPFKQRNVLLVGGADYDVVGTGDSGGSDTVDIRDGEERTILHDALRTTRGQGFSYLPGSLSEVRSIADLLSIQEWCVRTITDINATKTEFRKSLASQPADILHISTHGFYIPNSVGDKYAYRNIYSVSDNPLLRSGLAFSGANINWKGRDLPYIEDDGILTALEVLGLNLTETELVVLSACGTGLGHIDNGEGVYGLQRAFRLAGADNMIVSLWDIPDKQTSEFMIIFYGYIADGYLIKQAFDLTIKQARNKYPDRSDFWAGFVLIE